jgi:hypothetical protein
LTAIKDRLAHKDPETGLALIALPEMVEALVRIAPFGGFLPADRSAALEANATWLQIREELARLNLAVSLMTRAKLTAAQRQELLGKVRPGPKEGGEPPPG